jgi:hypothetical protein
VISRERFEHMIREDKPNSPTGIRTKLPRITVIATQNINWKTSGFALGIVGVAPRFKRERMASLWNSRPKSASFGRSRRDVDARARLLSLSRYRMAGCHEITSTKENGEPKRFAVFFRRRGRKMLTRI